MSADHTLRAALGVLMAVDADGRLKPHPQSPQAHVEAWEAEVLIAAMDIGDRYTDRDDNEVVLGWLAGAWILTVVIDQPATFDEDTAEVNAEAIAGDKPGQVHLYTMCGRYIADGLYAETRHGVLLADTEAAELGKPCPRCWPDGRQ